MKPPPLPPDLPEQSVKAPRRGLTGEWIWGLIIATVLALTAAIRIDSLISLPLLFGATLVPLLWLNRLVGGLRRGVITSRIRTGSRTTQLIAFNFSGPPDYFYRKKTPISFWMAWLFEGMLFLFVSPIFLVMVVGPIIEGGTR